MASSKLIELTPENTCKLCDNAIGKYTCPRCNLIYCSLECYQSLSHSECSESFYKTCIEEELSSSELSSEKSKMLEILNAQVESTESDSDDDSDCLGISERLAGVNLNDSDSIWAKLTEDEKQEFVAFLRSEDATKLVHPWEPYWTLSNHSKIVEVASAETVQQNSCPEIVEIPNFNDLTTIPPSECVKFNLINVMAAYAFMTRYFNGEYADFSKESATCLIDISLNLKNNENFYNFETSLKSVEQQCINSDWIITDAENLNLIKEDLNIILQISNSLHKKKFILAALSDIHNLFKTAIKLKEKKTDFAKVFPNDYFPTVKIQPKHVIKANLRKIDYFLSYTKDYYEIFIKDVLNQ